MFSLFPSALLVVDLAQPDPVVPIKPGEWYVMEVIANGDVITVNVRGTEVVKYQILHHKLKSGAIGLECPPNLKVVFRKIEIKQLRDGRKGSFRRESALNPERISKPWILAA